MTGISSLKKASSSLERLNKEIDKLNKPFVSSDANEDKRFWKPEVDKSGNGMAIIRFLPASEADGEDALPWVRIYSHGFKGPSGKWYIENSRTTIGQKDPVSEYNSRLWNESNDDDSPQRKQARAQKRRLGYISNILIVSDPANPSNEGKVFLYRYGKKIFDKIQEAMQPPFDAKGRSPDHAGYDPANAFVPFDLWGGANFTLRIRKVKDFRNYDNSTFDAPSALSEDDKYLESVWKQEHSLNEFVKPDQFKSYDELKDKLTSVLEMSYDELEGKRSSGSGARHQQTNKASSEDVFSSASRRQSTTSEADESPFAVDDDDDDLKSFRAMV